VAVIHKNNVMRPVIAKRLCRPSPAPQEVFVVSAFTVTAAWLLSACVESQGDLSVAVCTKKVSCFCGNEVYAVFGRNQWKSSICDWVWCLVCCNFSNTFSKWPRDYVSVKVNEQTGELHCLQNTDWTWHLANTRSSRKYKRSW